MSIRYIDPDAATRPETVFALEAMDLDITAAPDFAVSGPGEI